MSDLEEKLRQYADIAEASGKPHWASSMRRAVREIADLRAQLAEAQRDAELRLIERNAFYARYTAATKLLSNILGALPPPPVVAEGGNVYEFNPPPEHAMAMLRAFRTAIDAAMQEGK